MSTRGTLWTVAVAVVVTLLSGCSVGPKYTKPSVPMAPAYSEAPPNAFKEAEGWVFAKPADQTLRGDWWTMFGDPQLNTLEERINVDNQTLKVAEARFRGARATIKYNKAAKYPTIGASPAIDRNRLSVDRALPVPGAPGYGDFMMPFDFSYELDLWGRVHRQVEASRTEFQATAADLENVRLSLHTELATDYFTVRGLDTQQQLLQDAVTSYERALDLTRNRFEGGLSSAAEVAQAQTQLQSTRAQMIDLEAQRAQYEHAIGVLIGQPVEDFSLAKAPLKDEPPAIPIGLPAQLLERRPDIAAAERRVASANEQVGLTKIAYYPAVQLSAALGFEGAGIGDWLNWPSRFWAVGPGLVETLFDGGRRHAAEQGSEANYDATVATYRETTLNAFREVEDNLAALRVLEQEEQTQRTAVVAAQRSLELSNNRYRGGLVTYLEVVTAQNAALQNERTEADLLRRRMEASVLLIKALGGGWRTAALPRS